MISQDCIASRAVPEFTTLHILLYLRMAALSLAAEDKTDGEWRRSVCSCVMRDTWYGRLYVQAVSLLCYAQHGGSGG